MACSTCNTTQDAPIYTGDTVRFQLIAKKDNVVWDISGGSVTLYFKDPDGDVSGPFTATISDGPAGTAYYEVADTVLDIAGDWELLWVVTKTGVTLKSQEPFSVESPMV